MLNILMAEWQTGLYEKPIYGYDWQIEATAGLIYIKPERYYNQKYKRFDDR